MRTAPTITQAQMHDARGWIADCTWADDVTDLTDDEVLAGIERHYVGGWHQFVLDGQ